MNHICITEMASVFRDYKTIIYALTVRFNERAAVLRALNRESILPTILNDLQFRKVSCK